MIATNRLDNIFLHGFSLRCHASMEDVCRQFWMSLSRQAGEIFRDFRDFHQKFFSLNICHLISQKLCHAHVQIPRCSTYEIFTNICPKNRPNVGKYIIHGAYGMLYSSCVKKITKRKTCAASFGCHNVGWLCDYLRWDFHQNPVGICENLSETVPFFQILFARGFVTKKHHFQKYLLAM